MRQKYKNTVKYRWIKLYMIFLRERYRLGIICRYTTFVEIEFTIYPGNHPLEYSHEKVIVADQDGKIFE
ncbi:MAG TPA: hypothetical protein ENH02_02185 [Bacteroidetes bacterium]|nr:hypothetical protein [Bacteroidota bacterium]